MNQWLFLADFEELVKVLDAKYTGNVYASHQFSTLKKAVEKVAKEMGLSYLIQYVIMNVEWPCPEEFKVLDFFQATFRTP